MNRVKGQIKSGQFADFIALSDDYFRVPEAEIKAIESLLTVVNGEVVYGNGIFGPLAPPSIPVLPDWSPVIKVRDTTLIYSRKIKLRS